MKPNIANWTIVVLGAWSSRLFTPTWVGETFELKEMPVEFGLAAGVAQLKFTIGEAVLVPLQDRLIVGVTTPSDSALQSAENAAIVVLNTLKHTPVMAVGVNFEFEIENVTEPLASAFKLEDTLRVPDEFSIERTALVRQFKAQTGGIINFNLEFAQASGTATAGFNFHFDVKNTTQAVDSIRKAVVPCKDRALSFLKEVYDLELEEKSGEEENEQTTDKERTPDA